MDRNVTVTCLIDACHSGTILDLPYQFVSDRDLNEQEIPASIVQVYSGTDTQGRLEIDYGFFTHALPRWYWNIPHLEETKRGGLMTTILIDSLYSTHPSRSYLVMLDCMRFVRMLGAEPQLNSSQPMTMNNPFQLVSPSVSADGGNNKRHALLVGINYQGQEWQLGGSHNDVQIVKEYLINVQGLNEEKDITILIDDGHHESPTKENILNALQKLVNDCQPGDSVYVHYSGTCICLKNGWYEPTVLALVVCCALTDPLWFSRDFQLFNRIKTTKKGRGGRVVDDNND